MPITRRNSNLPPPVLEDPTADLMEPDTGSSTPTIAERQAPSHTKSKRQERWWRIKLGRGMIRDIKARAPYYISDWTDAWNYRVVPATWFIFFANIFPGIAFSLDLIETTGQYGVQEVLLSSFMAAFVASVFGGQPLLISGVTGPITVFNKTIYDIFENQDINYLHFIGWTYLWAAIFHWIAAVINAVKGLKYVTRFACDTFGFYVAAVYVQYGIQVVTRQFEQSSATSGFLGIILALITLVLPHYFNALASSGYVNRGFRRFCSDYGMPITVIAVTGLAYWGRFDTYVLEPNMTLPVIEASFVPANNRPWLVRFWELPGKYVGISLPFGFILFILFYFDANVSSLIAQGSEFPLKKPPGFHWDFFLLGITTFIAGLLGVPAPNGLIPQAPMHTASLVVMGYEDELPNKATDEHAVQLSDMEDGLRRRRSSMSSTTRRRSQVKDSRQPRKEVPIAVVEQRVSNLAQGALCLVLMTKPFEHVLGLIPKGVLAGLFWYMGTDALLTSGVTAKMLFLIRDKRSTPSTEPLLQVRRSRIIWFTIIELIGFGATFAITQTIAAIGFPIIIMLLVPLRVFIVPKLGFRKEELDILDGPTAGPFTMESVGGSM